MSLPDDLKRDVHFATQFKKDFKKSKKQGKDIDLLKSIIINLANDVPLAEKYRDHDLHGHLKGFRECHIMPDWLLMYKKSENKLLITLSELNSHSNMF